MKKIFYLIVACVMVVCVMGAAIYRVNGSENTAKAMDAINDDLTWIEVEETEIEEIQIEEILIH